MATSPSSPKLLPVLLFNAAYIGIAVVASLASGNREFIFYIAVMAVLIAMFFLGEKLEWTQSLGAVAVLGSLLFVSVSSKKTTAR